MSNAPAVEGDIIVVKRWRSWSALPVPNCMGTTLILENVKSIAHEGLTVPIQFLRERGIPVLRFTSTFLSYRIQMRKHRIEHVVAFTCKYMCVLCSFPIVGRQKAAASNKATNKQIVTRAESVVSTRIDHRSTKRPRGQ